MPYSLVSAATLGFDLVRLPAGRSVAEVLLAGLGADAAALAAVAAAHPAPRPRPRAARRARRPLPPRPRDGRRRPARPRRRRRPRATAPPSSWPSSSAAPSATPRPWSGCSATTSSAGAPGGGRPGPPTCWPQAADVLADAALGHWAAGVLPAAGAARADRPLRPRPRPRRRGRPRRWAPTSVPPATIAELLDAVRALDDARSGRLAGRRRRGPGRPPAVGRRHARGLLGRARLRAHPRRSPPRSCTPSRPSSTAASGPADGAAGTWNAVAGCVQGTAMADLLDEASLPCCAPRGCGSPAAADLRPTAYAARQGLADELVNCFENCDVAAACRQMTEMASRFS